MFPYCVVASNPEEARITLKDHAGRLHLARALNALPDPGAVLKGSRPHLGFGLLLCLTSGRLHRVIFETINSRDAALMPPEAAAAQPFVLGRTDPSVPHPAAVGSTAGGRPMAG